MSAHAASNTCHVVQAFRPATPADLKVCTTFMAQNVSRTDSCIVLGSLARLVIVPRVAGLARSRFGRPKFTVLNRLKTSHRTPTPTPELSLICRWIVRSMFWKPGPVRRLRNSLPNTPEGTAWNAAVLNHCATVWDPLGSPTTFGSPVILMPTLLLLWF